MPGETVSCSRCGKEGRGLAWPPYAGDVGQKILRSVCEACWEEWLGVQTRIINEYRLNVLDPDHQRRVAEECLLFLGLKEGNPVTLPTPSADRGGSGR